MKLIDCILSELGAEGLKNFTVIPSFGGYFCGVKSVVEFSSEKITLALRRVSVILEGENLAVERYFEEDIFIKGDIKVIKIE